MLRGHLRRRLRPLDKKELAVDKPAAAHATLKAALESARASAAAAPKKAAKPADPKKAAKPAGGKGERR